MSYVQNITLWISSLEDEGGSNPGDEHVVITQLNKRFARDAVENGGAMFGLSSVRLVRVDHFAAAPVKVIESPLYIASGNYVDLRELAAELSAIEWKDPDAVALVWRDQEEDRPTVYSLADLRSLPPNT